MMSTVFLICLASTSLSIESNFFREEDCAQKGGYCVLENECSHAVEASYKNLCATQKGEGAVCCKNFPEEKLNCYQTHNTCKKPEECPKNLNRGQKGCKQGNICCTLV